ncbi:MAG TPA: error-prone DNA polymerase [Polyangia bacterium]|nr:error-prone DNA polymerase [Polyangia bacterium]
MPARVSSGQGEGPREGRSPFRAEDYVELRCRSAFSFLDGASSPEELVDAAAAGGHDTLALGDPRGVYGAPRFFAAARKAGVRPIVGAELALAADAHGAVPRPVLLLVEDRTGYQNLCRLLTRAWDGRRKDEGPVATHVMLAEHAAGLVALAGAEARADLPDLVAAFGRESVFLEAQRHHDADEARRLRATIAQAGIAGVGLVATNDVRYATPSKRILHDVLTCARHHATVDDIGRRLPGNGERWLKRPAEMSALFRDLPAAVRASRAIAERCAFTLADLGYAFPSFPVAPGETEQSTLAELCEAGVRRRYDPTDPLLPKVRAQLRRELGIIERLGLAGYFLVVWDIVEFARGKHIMIQGRGSAANSAVCYLLGITAVDPVRMELLFERFLSEERVESATNAADRMPDIDLDLPSGDRRELCIQHVYAKYGARGAAMTANVITYRPRMAVRDVGRALGLAEDQLGRITKHLPGSIVEPGTPLAAYIDLAGFPRGDRRTRLLGELATALLDLPRHLGQHSGGMVIAAGRLDQVVPLEPASMPGRVIVQWDKDDCADLGLVKVDLLGLGMMAVLEDVVPMIQRHEGVTIDYGRLPPGDPESYRMLQAADTVGTFQVESRAQMATLPRMKPTCFYDLVVEVAIIRPGPIVGKMLNPYLLRRAGEQDVTYPHPSLEPILKRTLGIPLFQEQLIRMAMVAAGFSGGQADELRRAMGFKRSQQRMNAIEVDLRAGMNARGITGAAQDEIVQGIKSFALYGFPESHAASFALLAYASVYLKAHHPAAFLACLLNNWPMGFYHPATLVTDAVRHGVEVRPIDVTCSGWLCDLEDEGKSVRLGLRYARGFREETGKRIEAARAARPFGSLADFESRVTPSADERAVLADIGAFAALGGTRRQALWQVEALGRSGALFAPHPHPTEASPLPEMTEAEELTADFRGTGLTTGPHPMVFARHKLQKTGVLTAAELLTVPDGRRARVGGVVVVRQHPETAKGFVFITIEDETGFANAIVTPQRFARWREVIVETNALVIGGVVQNQRGVVAIKADTFEPIGGRPAAIDISHDFH